MRPLALVAEDARRGPPLHRAGPVAGVAGDVYGASIEVLLAVMLLAAS